MKKILVTGSSGFIGANLVSHLSVTRPELEVVGLDSIDTQRDYNYTKRRRKALHPVGFKEKSLNMCIDGLLKDFLKKEHFDLVIHLAALPGVGYSFKHPKEVIDNNITSTMKLLEAMKETNTKNLIFASSSSVYGEVTEDGYKRMWECDLLKPISPYSSSKVMTENLVRTFIKNNKGFSALGFRFFTVYGPWVRRDLAMFKFAQKIKNNRKIKLYSYSGKKPKRYSNENFCKRDFTHVFDVCRILEEVMYKMPREKFKVYNIGTGENFDVGYMAKQLSKWLGKKLNYEVEKKPSYDVPTTLAAGVNLLEDFGLATTVGFDYGVKKFAEWYKLVS